MVPFSYLRRAKGSGVLRRLLELDDNVLPQTIKFVAAKALNDRKYPPQPAHTPGSGNYSTKYATHKPVARDYGGDVAELIQEKVAHTSAEQWTPSAIITVVYYLSEAGVCLESATRDLFVRKVTEADNLNIIDLWQALTAASRLRIYIPVGKLKQHLETNTEALLRPSRCRNVSSAIRAFSTCGEALDALTLQLISSHYLDEMSAAVDFKDATNFANALAMQCSLLCAKSKDETKDDGGRATLDGDLAEAVDRVIDDTRMRTKDSDADLEGIADTFDAIVQTMQWRSFGEEAYARRVEQMQNLVSSINSRIGAVDVSYAVNSDSKSRNAPKETKAEPRVLRVVLRCLMQAGIYHPELIDKIFYLYRRQPQSWSAYGTAEVLSCAAFFGMRDTALGDIAEHVSNNCLRNLLRHVPPSRILLDICVAAAQAADKRSRVRLHRLVADVLAHEDPIDERDLALAMLTLQLSPGTFEMSRNCRAAGSSGVVDLLHITHQQDRQTSAAMEKLDFNQAAQNAQAIPHNQQEKQMQEEAKRESILEARRMTLRTLLTVEAQERLNRIAMVKPEKATQIENYLMQTAFRAGRHNKMDDPELKHLIEAMGAGASKNISNIKVNPERRPRKYVDSTEALERRVGL
ncbi:double-stranded DNA-binding domain containing protein [Babesia ovata]|uniref:Double-stranded DNA-binding domain containing protein n=1 Tax=Babesia ovata TaxID=189622 RepID=A0A2H6K8I3_9APIC|nr:double-stranded DNA-binding domain containing protein [Babesia ovata]GBE59301.1 double-stranded DNA-binding domain containing protein [Babesia ovata]